MLINQAYYKVLPFPANKNCTKSSFRMCC